MTEAQGVELIALLESIRRIVELAAWSTFIATGFVIGNTLHRFAGGR